MEMYLRCAWITDFKVEMDTVFLGIGFVSDSLVLHVWLKQCCSVILCIFLFHVVSFIFV